MSRACCVDPSPIVRRLRPARLVPCRSRQQLVDLAGGPIGGETDPLARGGDAISLSADTRSLEGRKKKLRTIFGPSPSAFGHPGAGGSHAFADPEHRIAFAYVMNQMEPGVLPGPKALRLVEAIYG